MEHLLKNYCLVRPLGEGNYSRVYECSPRNTVTAQRFVTKIIPRDSPLRVEREILALEKMQNSGRSPQLYGVFTDDSHYAIVMENVGSNLNSCSDASGDYAKKLLRETAECLAECHSRGIVHLDPNFKNMCLDKSGQVKIIDFGMSLHEEHKTFPVKLRKAVGTPYFMAPEMAMSGYAGFASDMWSFGTMVYFLAAQEHLIRGAKRKDIHRNTAYLSQSELDEKLLHIQDEGVKDLLCMCLALAPSERPAFTDILTHPYLKQNSM